MSRENTKSNTENVLEISNLCVEYRTRDSVVKAVNGLDLTLKKGVLLAAIARENKIIIPGGLTTIQEGDHVVVVTKSQVFDDLTDILL